MNYTEQLKAMSNEELIDEIGHLLWDAEAYREIGVIEKELLSRIQILETRK